MTSTEHDSDGDAQIRRAGGRDLTTGSIPRHLVAFSLPMLAGSALQVAYSLVNGVWVGRFLGEQALAAVTVSMPVVFVLISVAAGLTLASNILVAQDAGARDWARLQRVVQTSYALIGGISLALVVVGVMNAGRLLTFIHTPSDIFPIAERYLRIFLWTLPFSFGLFLIGSILRGIGDSKTPVYFQSVSVILNAALDPVLIFGLLGAPKLGLNGTAYATIISQGVAVAALLIYIAYQRRLVNPDWRRLRIDAPTAWVLARIGVPAMIQQSVVSVSMFGIMRYVSLYGSVADAAFGAALRIDQVAFLPALTVGMAASTLAGQNIGAGKVERVSRVFRWGIVLSGGISLLIMLTAVSIPGVLLRAFTDDPQTLAIGSQYLRIVAFTYVLYAVMFVSHGVINGAGHTPITTVVSIIALWGVRIPLAGYLSHRLHGVVGIWLAMLASVAVGMILSLAYFYSGRWRTPITNIAQRAR